MSLNDDRLTTSSTDTTFNLIRILCKQKPGLNICHINAQSLNNKIDEFRYIFENSGVDVICVSETWFSEKVFDNIIALSGFKMYRCDRSTHGGGVAIFVKKEISSKFVVKSEYDEKVEHIFVEVQSMGNKLLIGCIYRPNKRIDLDNFHTKLENVTLNYENIVLCGDFNSDILNERYLLDAMMLLGLFTPNLLNPTHYTATNQSLLDLYFVSSKQKVLLYDQISVPCFSKHDLIFLNYNFIPQYSNENTMYYDFKHMDYNVLFNELNNADWNSIYYMPEVDSQVNFLEENLAEIFNRTVPLKTVSHKNAKPWFNGQIKTKIQQRDYAFKCWKRFKTDDLHIEYTNARKEVNKLIKCAKSSYYSNLFSSAVGTKKTWRIIRDIGISKSQDANSSDIDVNLLNESFTKLPNINANPNYYSSVRPISSTRLLNSFSFRCVTQADVFKVCLSIKSNAVGPDNIHPKFLKAVLPVILPQLTHVFNTIITKSVFPLNWKCAKIIPVPKNKNDYRPIAILSYLSKVLERLLYEQIADYVCANSLLTNRQSGFRPKHSCITALIDVSEEIRGYIDSGNIAFLALLDHSKAFDMVNHNMLCMKLNTLFNFNSSATCLMSSYLENRYQYVNIKGQISNLLPVTKGVPQGSILGPLLFSVYINDLPQQLSYCKIHMYADDVQLYLCSSISRINESVIKLNSDLLKIHQWAISNGLCLNPTKSKCLIISRSTQTHIDPDVILNNQRIEIVNKTKNLGIIFNSSLTWSDHIITAAGKTFSMLRALWKTQHLTPVHIRMLLAKTYLLPTLLYGCEIFASSDYQSSKKLNNAYNSILRYIFNLRRSSHITPYERKIFGVRFCDLLKIRTLLLMQKIIFTNEPSYLFNRLSFTRSRRNNNLIQIRHYKLVSEWQFLIHCIRLWNSLPSSIQFESNATQFRKSIFSLYN